MPFAASANCRIYYRLQGEPRLPLLVLVHALGLDHTMWDPQITPLLNAFQVLRLDPRGHGASGVPPGDYTMRQLAEDVLAVVDTVGGTRFAYGGLSLGGMIGQYLGARAAKRLTHLVLANTSPRVPDPSMFDARAKTALAEGMPALEQAVMERLLANAKGVPLTTVTSLRHVFRGTAPIGYAGCRAAIRDLDDRPLLSTIRVPTLILGGDDDITTPWQGHGSMLAEEIPKAVAVRLPRAHRSNVVRPSAFTSALYRFLAPPSAAVGRSRSFWLPRQPAWKCRTAPMRSPMKKPPATRCESRLLRAGPQPSLLATRNFRVPASLTFVSGKIVFQNGPF